MKFLPDKKPRRARQPLAKEILDVSTPEHQEFTFDPERDISLDRRAVIAVTIDVPKTNPEDPPFCLDSADLLASLVTVAPELAVQWKDDEVLKRLYVQYVKDKLKTKEENIRLFYIAANQVIWAFPEARAELVDLTPGSLVKTAKALLNPSEKIDLTIKQQALKRLEEDLKKSELRPVIAEAGDIMVFLVNFFPDGRKVVEGLMQKHNVTEQKILEALDLIGDRTIIVALNFSILFPSIREELKQKKPLLDFLRARMTKMQVGIPHEYAQAVMLSGVLASQHTQLDHTGLQVVRSSPKPLSRPAQPLPSRDLTLS